GSASQRTRHHHQATRTTIRKSRCRRGASPPHLKAIATEEENTNEHSRSVNCHVSPNLTYTELQQQIHDDLRIQHPDWVNSDGSSPRVILTSRASGNCSAFRREGDPTSLPLLLIAPSNRELQGKDLCNMF